MDWKTLFSKPDSISTEMTRDYIATHPPGEYQLLDVRQPNEYQSQHIPGAMLIPLNQLPDRMKELDRAKETIVYCRSGARSNSACQILRQNGFATVFNMSGGILQWQGLSAMGPEDTGMDFFVNGTYENSLTMAYAMEQGLRQFYLQLAEKLSQPDVSALLKTMAKFEDGHMAQLSARYKTALNKPEKQLQAVEGGISIDQLGRAFGEHLKTPESVIQLAMMFESQAYDLYSRLAHQQSDNDLKSFYLDMAKEERKHLDKLSGQLDNLLS